MNLTVGWRPSAANPGDHAPMLPLERGQRSSIIDAATDPHSQDQSFKQRISMSPTQHQSAPRRMPPSGSQIEPPRRTKHSTKEQLEDGNAGEKTGPEGPMVSGTAASPGHQPAVFTAAGESADWQDVGRPGTQGGHVRGGTSSGGGRRRTTWEDGFGHPRGEGGEMAPWTFGTVCRCKEVDGGRLLSITADWQRCGKTVPNGGSWPASQRFLASGGATVECWLLSGKDAGSRTECGPRDSGSDGVGKKASERHRQTTGRKVSGARL